MAPNLTLRNAIFASRRTQQDVAKEAGVNPAILSGIIHGRVNPDETQKQAIAEALQLPVHELFPEAVAS